MIADRAVAFFGNAGVGAQFQPRGVHNNNEHDKRAAKQPNKSVAAMGSLRPPIDGTSSLVNGRIIQGLAANYNDRSMVTLRDLVREN